MRRSVCGVLGLLILAVGCSSDTSGSVPSPKVTQVIPATAATGVALTSDVVFSFSDALTPGSVTSASVKLTYKGVAAPSTLSLENNNRSVRLTPSGTLGNNRIYQVFVTSDVQSAGGVAATAFASSFSTVQASASVSDFVGDTFGVNAGQPDVASLAASQGLLTIVLTFNNAIAPWNAGALTSVGGYIDIDADQDPNTGFQSASDFYRPVGDSGASGLGDEYLVSLFQNANGSFTVYDLNDSLGTVMPTFDAHTITVTVPLALLGNDDGNVNIAALVGSTSEPTDIAPSTGHLTLGDPGVPAPPGRAALTATRPPFARRWSR